MTVDGREVIVGVASFVSRTCDTGSFMSRVDAEIGFVNDYVAQADPDWAPAGDTDSSSEPPDEDSGCTAAGGLPGAPGAALFVLLLCAATRRAGRRRAAKSTNGQRPPPHGPGPVALRPR